MNMNTESLSDHGPPQKDYQQLQKILKRRCEEISKDNDALSSRLINLKLLIYKSENQCRKLKERLEYHGVDYRAAAIAATSNNTETTDFISEKVGKVENNAKSRQKHIRKKKNKMATKNNSSALSDSSLYPLNASAADFDTELSSGFMVVKDNLNSI